MDGQVLLQMFAEGSSPRQRPVEKVRLGLETREGVAYSDEDAAQVEERLRDLGYLA